MDFALITGLFSGLVTPILLALSAVAAIMILPNVTKWGYNHVIEWFGGDQFEDKSDYESHKEKFFKERALAERDEDEYHLYAEGRDRRERTSRHRERYNSEH